MSIQSKIESIGKALALITPNCYHYWRSAPSGVKQYIVWAEDSEGNSFGADNHNVERGIHGTIDLFTKYEFDAMADRIQASLNGLDRVYWRLQSVQYEEETGFIHYEWEFSAV